MKRLLRMFFFVVVLGILLNLLLMSSIADTVGTTETPVSNDYAGLKITAKSSYGSSNGEYSFDEATGTLTFGAKAYFKYAGLSSGYESTTTTITVYNNQSYSIDITLTYSGDYEPTATSLPAKNSDGSYTISANSSFTLSITSGNSSSDRGMHSATVTIGVVTNSVTVTFASATGGSMAQSSVETDDDGYFTYTPVPVSGYTFWGFRKTDGGYIETNASKASITTATKSTYQIVAATTLTPVFIKSDSATFYSYADAAYYPFLDEALAVAKNASSNKKISVYLSGVAYAKESSTTSFTVASGVTLLVPYGSADSGSTSETSDDYIPIKNAYRTLTILNGTTLVVNGTLIVNGVQGQYRYLPSSGVDRTGCMYMGTIQGDYGCIDLRGSISVENGGSLYARGLIIENDATTGKEINNGTGEIVAKDGSDVYQLAELIDWRGGTSSSKVYQDVFPLNVFHMQNIQVKTEYQYGSALSAFYYVRASNITQTGKISAISKATDSLFTLSSGSVVFRYDRVSARSDGTEIFAKTTVEVCGDISINKIEIAVKALGQSYTMSTAGKEIPLSGAFDIEVASGSKMTLTENVKVLPGARVTIKAGGEFVLDGGKLYLYDVGHFSPSYSYNKYRRMPISARLGAYSHSRLSGGGQTDPDHSSVLCHSNVLVNEQTDGELIVEGTLTIKNGGGVYSSTDETSESTLQFSSDSSQIQTGGATTGKIVIESATDGLVTIQEVENAYETTTAENFSFAIGKIMGTSGTAVTTFSAATYYSDGSAWYTLRVHSDTSRNEGTAINTKYRLEDYLWLNALCYFDSGLTPATVGTITVTTYKADGTTVTNTYSEGVSSTYDGVQVVVVDEIVYLVKAIPADEIPDDVTFSISYNDGTNTYNSVKFTVSLEAYDAGDDNALKQALLTYGEAAEDYFDSNTTLETGHSVTQNPVNGGATVSSTGKPQSWNGATLETTGANVYFDEALRLGISYSLSAVPEGYEIVQVGLLVGDQVGEDLLLENATKAYLLYDTLNGKNVDNVTISNETLSGAAPGNRPWDKDNNVINVTPDSLDQPTDLKYGTIIFDLAMQDYKTMFALRPAIVLTDGNGNYVCVYGRQIGYGLEAYINGVYGTATDEYKYLLEQTWALATTINGNE